MMTHGENSYKVTGYSDISLMKGSLKKVDIDAILDNSKLYIEPDGTIYKDYCFNSLEGFLMGYCDHVIAAAYPDHMFVCHPFINGTFILEKI